MEYNYVMSIWNIQEENHWSELAKRSESFVDYLTDRGDVAVILLPDPRTDEEKFDAPLPAGSFYPSLARMNIDASQIFEDTLEDLGHIDPNAVLTQKYYPKLIGVLVHESAHAKHSTYEIPQGTPQAVSKWITILEEIRCENKMLDIFPQYAKHIATIVKSIVAKETFAHDKDTVSKGTETRQSAAQTAILVLGRMNAGVFEDSLTMSNIYMDLDSKLDGDLGTLESLWEEVFDLEDDDVEMIIDIATRINLLIDPNGEEDKQSAGSSSSGSMPCGAYMPSEGGEPAPEDGAASNGQGAGGTLGDLLDDLGEAASQAVKDGYASRTYELPQSESEKNEQRRIEIQAGVKKIVPMGSGNRTMGYGWSSVSAIKTQPNATDISRSRAITKAIESAHFRDVTRTVLASELPPGRFVIREAMNRQAQISNGQAISAKPWKQVRRRSVENPPITLMVLSDISGSMGAYQREVASFTWAMANGVKKIHGNVGALAWNGSGGAPREMITPRSRISDTIDYYSAGGGSDGLPDAIRAGDGLMNLGFGEGVRVLVIITDGELPNKVEIQKEIDLLANKGVLILWIVTSKFGMAPKSCTVAKLDKPEDFGKIVGPKIVEALSRA
jgi:hypothetical protein